MLAYSSISHAGFLLIGLSAGSALGGRALMYYLIVYAAMAFGSFAVVAARERELGEPVTLDNLAGFGWERPFLGIAMWFFLFGFAGLPLGGGFVAKFYVLSAAYRHGWTWLVIVGVIATLVSLYYYLARCARDVHAPSAELQLAPVRRLTAARAAAARCGRARTRGVGWFALRRRACDRPREARGQRAAVLIESGVGHPSGCQTPEDAVPGALTPPSLVMRGVVLTSALFCSSPAPSSAWPPAAAACEAQGDNRCDSSASPRRQSRSSTPTSPPSAARDEEHARRRPTARPTGSCSTSRRRRSRTSSGTA